MTLVCATGTRLLTPTSAAPLAGYVARTGSYRGVHDPLEANALLLARAERRVLFVSVDLLYAGPELTTLVETAAGRHGIPREAVVVTASHTHFAPATDAGKPRFGVVDAAYLALARAALEALVDEVCTRSPVPCAIEWVASRTNLNVNRRSRWPLPTWTRRGPRMGPSTIFWPNRAAPVDDHIDVVRLRGSDGRLLAVAWKFACHPVAFPDRLTVSAEFPGEVREAIRASTGTRMPVLFWQGFAGDVRPALRGRWGPLDFAKAVVRGPTFGKATWDSWRAWTGQLAQAVVSLIRQPAPALEATLAFASARLPLAALLDDGSGPPLDDSRQIAWQRIEFAAGLDAIFVGAEVCSPYALARGARHVSLGVAYAGDVFGYLPSPEQIREGGYEGSDFLVAFGLPPRWRPGIERRWHDALTAVGASPDAPGAVGSPSRD